MSESSKEENRRRDLAVLEKGAQYFREHRQLVGEYDDRLVDTCTMIPMCEDFYAEKFDQFNDVFETLFELLDILQDSGIGILLPDMLRRKI